MTSYDAIVIGGGVVGASAAYHLVRAGARTLLVDRRDVGRATDAGAGILSTAAKVDDPDPLERFEARERRWRAAKDRGYAEVGPEEAKALFPPLARVEGAIHCGRGARVDGRLLAGALRRAAEKRGLMVRHAPVEELVLGRGGFCGVRTGGERIACGDVVIAAGAWSRVLGVPLGIEIPVAPQRGQIVHLGLPGMDTSAWPIVLAFRGHYLVPWNDSRVAVGATRETGSGFAPHATAAGVLEVLTEALRVAPGLAQAEIREIRVGLRPASPDGLPILGPVPGFPNLLLATGHGAVGLQLGPYSGKVVAGMIAGGADETEIGPFGLARFTRAS